MGLAGAGSGVDGGGDLFRSGAPTSDTLTSEGRVRVVGVEELGEVAVRRLLDVVSVGRACHTIPCGISVEVQGVVHRLASGLSKGGLTVRQRCGLGIGWTVSNSAGRGTVGSSCRLIGTSGGGRHLQTILRSIVRAGFLLLGHDNDLHRACVN